MFIKLFKYDFLAVIKKLVFYYIVLIAISIFAKIIELIFKNTDFYVVTTLIDFGFDMIASLGLTATIILCMIRYYKNMLSDQGYLTHTLPVKKSTILLSKIAATLAIELITILVMLLSYVIYSIDSIPQMLNDLSSILKQLDPTYYGNAIGIAILVLILIVFCIVFQVTMISMCLTLGAAHNKNKLVMAFVYYMAINFVLQILLVVSVVAIVIIIQALGTFNIGYVYILLVLAILGVLALIVASYFVNLMFLKKKLNLE